ncbi:putative ABC transport system permease protein [Sediminihabitans luteus]|uniref:Putative ABC transport system permease protein n=1 Tax=Sediminihabitans luteus TaxID=1138585 RepID=A0A2M9D138_9CELL|nr:ABC transporter permease [Sediminihabitans luteus]PJJ77921.1 putative ABC transport system permease protein [Sediminihabitans luteus]GII99722.1 ABC transporter permease [Sediminihabitans luteus]
MFVALRDLRFARGRFVLMATVIVLITYLVVFLASLTEGLADESTSGVTGLPADQLAFTVPDDAEPAGPGGGPTFTGSQVTQDQWEAWAQVDGVADAQPLGIAQTRATSPATTAAVTAFGLAPSSGLLPVPDDGADAVDVAPGTTLLSSGAADDLGAEAGDVVRIGDLDLTVTTVLDVDASYAHTPVLWTSLEDWQSLGAHLAPDAAPTTVATVVALTTDLDDDALAAADTDIGTQTESRHAAKSAISSYSSEHGSLLLMEVFLVGISALVVGAFFTVWTISRSGDIAVLKALGASTRYLMRDAIGQALVILAIGVGLGTFLAAGTAALLSSVAPTVVNASTVLLPAAVLVVLGVAGAWLAVLQITRVDPHAALAAR